MGRPPLSEEVVGQVEQIWATDPKRTAKLVHEEMNRRLGKPAISLRKTQEIISALKRTGAGTFEPVVWHPWRNPQETSEDTSWLLRVQGLMITAVGRRLYCHEALWAMRLRASIHELEDHIQIALLALYSHREVMSQRLQRPVETESLDDLLSFAPWSPARWDDYETAIQNGWVNPPHASTVMADPSTGGDVLFHGSDALLLWFDLARSNPEALFPGETAFLSDEMIGWHTMIGDSGADHVPDHEILGAGPYRVAIRGAESAVSICPECKPRLIHELFTKEDSADER